MHLLYNNNDLSIKYYCILELILFMFIWTLSLKFWYRQLSKQVRFKVKSKIYFALKYNNYIKVKSNFFRFKIWTFFLYMNFYIKFSSKGGRYCLRRQYICPLHLERNRMIWCHRYFYIVQYKELPGINKHKNMGFFYFVEKSSAFI